MSILSALLRDRGEEWRRPDDRGSSGRRWRWRWRALALVLVLVLAVAVAVAVARAMAVPVARALAMAMAMAMAMARARARARAVALALARARAPASRWGPGGRAWAGYRAPMNLDDLIGTVTTLRITRLARADALLAANDEKGAPRIIIARDELPRDAVVEDEVRVFVHLDADGDVVATTHMPKLVRGEVTFLQVTGVTPFGAFVDWGLKKDLLVHNRYQTGAVRVGSRHPFGLIFDDTGRLTGTMKIREMVVPPTDMAADSWVDGEAWREEPGLGLFVILQKCFIGLLPAREPHRLKQGEKASFRVAEVLPDGKVVLSLRAHVAEQMGADATQLLTHLRTPGAAPISEAWPPERIAQVFGMSKKAFKRAVGRLLKDERVTIDPDGAITLRAS